MRRAYALLAVPLLFAAAAVAGCGSSAPSDPSQSVSVSGKFDAAPKVTIPAQAPSAKLYSKTLISGNGAALASNDSFEGYYEAYIWSGTTHKLAVSTYTTHKESLFSGSLLPGLSTALKGAKQGSRVLAVIPPKQGFGTQGNSQLGVKGTDTLVFVIDVDKKISSSLTGKQTSNGGGALPTVKDAGAGKAPVITVDSKKKPPAKTTAVDLIKGTGPKVTSGQTLLVQYEGVIWRTGKTFDSSWARGQATEFSLAQVVPGWSKGLTGHTVGSRVLISIPPADGYGKTGNSQAGIKGTDTLVFVVDILAATTA